MSLIWNGSLNLEKKNNIEVPENPHFRWLL